MYRRLVACCIALGFGSAAHASTLVATFEPGCCDVDAGYLVKGFQWINFLHVDIDTTNGQYGPEDTHSGHWVGTTERGVEGYISDEGPVFRKWDFIGAWISSPFNDNQIVHFAAASPGQGITYTRDIVVSQQSTWYQFDFLGINGFEFHTVEENNLAFDDVVVKMDGDANGDFLITIDDLNAVRNNFGTTETLGDANSDGIVNISDLNAVRNNFDSTPPEASTPEPTSAFLALTSLALAAFVVRSRRSTSSRSLCSFARST